MRHKLFFRAVLFLIFFCSALAPDVGLAQSFSMPGQERNKGAGAERCTDLAAEPQIIVTKQGGSSDRTEQVLDFTIMVLIANPCPMPVQLQQGSFVSYQTNFPSQVRDTTQLLECISQRRDLSGVIPPRQKQPFSFRVQGCIFPTDQLETPRVTLDAGRLVTEKGEKPIPSLTETAP